ncbi:hypothetical protein Q8A67_023476 [Cirrhinus molitorella]|uniref:Dehydrogenase/reductase SDR family member 13 n=1 Tax=Cirrhinus molitorella TaxID=172907 RepID=A0AA88P3I8_9TELE|nr:hypothetical protein Q8A67_023476 [Cirrhinus molitorella]
MFIFLLICGGLVGFYLLLYVKCKSTAKLHGKTVIVTGANTGIGKATALDLAKRGARVILACRDESRARAAVTDIQRESGNKEVLYMHLDLASLKSVRSFAENFLKKESRLDILINNAGLVIDGKTEDGFGMIFGVNHLGHFLLTILLLERLKECGPSRIVTVSSMAHWWGKIDFDCINTHKDVGLGNSAIALLRLYSHSKLCNVLFTHELAKRLKGTNVTCYSLHPGAIKTEIGRHSNLWWRLFMAPILLLFFTDVESGAQTSLYCALQEGITPLSGRYFSSCAVQNVSAKAKDDAVAKKLWEVSERLPIMFTVLLICGGLVGLYLLLYVTVLKQPKCKSTAKLHGKTVIVTGANTGIGKATALDLAKRGARVILACRDESRAQAAVTDIQRESGNKEVLYMHLDLASLKSVRSFAENFLKRESRLDILINNAGLVVGGKTEDGFGRIFGVNHLGHFLLTTLLLERLKESGPSRIVTVSSNAHWWGKIDFDCINTHKDLGLGKSAVAIMRLYGHSKLCNVLFTYELAKRLKGTNVTCYSLHPGGIKTEIGRHVNIWWQLVLVPILLLFFSDVESGAQTSLYCALQEGIEPLSGRYFSNCAVQNVSAKARDDAVAKKLWEVSERLVGLA